MTHLRPWALAVLLYASVACLIFSCGYLAGAKATTCAVEQAAEESVAAPEELEPLPVWLRVKRERE